MNIKDLLVYLLFAIGTFLVTIIGITGIILSAMSDTFPNTFFYHTNFNDSSNMEYWIGFT